MTLYPDSKYKFFQLENNAPGIFGETYVVAVGVNTSGPYFKGECYVLTKRPEPRLHHDKWRFSTTDIPPELLTVDNDFIIDEGRQFAETYLIDFLYQEAEQRNNSDLLGIRVNLIENKTSSLVNCWVRNVFHDQIIEIAKSTECESLSRYLTIVTSLKSFSAN